MLAGANLCWDQLPICIKAQIYVLTDSVSKKLTGKYIQFFLPFFKILWIYTWKMTPFLISRIRASHLKNTPFRENGFEHYSTVWSGVAGPG